MTELDKELREYLADRAAEKRDGYTLKRLGNQLEEYREQNRRDHDEFRRRFAEHGRRLGALEVTADKVDSRIANLEGDVEKVEEDSKTYRLDQLKDHKDSATWWKRQGAVWIVGAVMTLLGSFASLLVALLVYWLTKR
jgi:chromosome segregation ATPase